MLSAVELKELASNVEELSGIIDRNKEISLEVKITVYDTNGDEVGAIENFRGVDGDSTPYFYPKGQ